jgi:uncharacterized protein involved in exopolysaccharide biosynthesis
VRFLRQQLDTLGTQLAASERALREFRERERVVDIETQASTQVSRLAELQASRTQLDAEREALAGCWRGAPHRAPGRGSHRLSAPAAFPSLLRSQATAELLSTLAQLEDHAPSCSFRRELKDPDVIVLTQRIAEVESSCAAWPRRTCRAHRARSGRSTLARPLGAAELERAAARPGGARRAAAQRTPQALGEIFTTLQTRLRRRRSRRPSRDPGVRLIDAATLPDER